MAWRARTPCEPLLWVSFQSGPQRRKLLVSLQSSEVSGRFLHGGRGPAHRHRGRAPALHVPAYAPHRAHGILDDVGTGERAPQLLRNPSRVTVRISSMPSRIEPATPDHSRWR